jgi:hypothetical protein
MTYDIDGSTVTLVGKARGRSPDTSYRVMVDGIERGTIVRGYDGWNARTLHTSGERADRRDGEGSDPLEELASRFVGWVRADRAPSLEEAQALRAHASSRRRDAGRLNQEAIDGLRTIRERLSGHLTDEEKAALDHAVRRLEGLRGKAAGP